MIGGCRRLSRPLWFTRRMVGAAGTRRGYFVLKSLECGLGCGAVTEYGALETIGIHCLADLYDCPAGILDDEAYIKAAVRQAADEGLATLLHEVSHHFHPQGVTALGLVAESHIAIHTWPEFGYAAVDVFTCGSRANAEKACRHLARALHAGRHTIRKLARGTGLPRDLPAVRPACATACGTCD